MSPNTLLQYSTRPKSFCKSGTKKRFCGVSAVSAQQHDPINFPAPPADSPAPPFQTDSAGFVQVPSVFPTADGYTERSCSALRDPEVLATRQNQLRLPLPRMRHVGAGRVRENMMVVFKLAEFLKTSKNLKSSEKRQEKNNLPCCKSVRKNVRFIEPGG